MGLLEFVGGFDLIGAAGHLFSNVTGKTTTVVSGSGLVRSDVEEVLHSHGISCSWPIYGGGGIMIAVSPEQAEEAQRILDKLGV